MAKSAPCSSPRPGCYGGRPRPQAVIAAWQALCRSMLAPADITAVPPCNGAFALRHAAFGVLHAQRAGSRAASKSTKMTHRKTHKRTDKLNVFPHHRCAHLARSAPARAQPFSARTASTTSLSKASLHALLSA